MRAQQEERPPARHSRPGGLGTVEGRGQPPSAYQDTNPSRLAVPAPVPFTRVTRALGGAGTQTGAQDPEAPGGGGGWGGEGVLPLKAGAPEAPCSSLGPAPRTDFGVFA